MPNQTAQEAGLEKAREVLRKRRAFAREVEAGEQSLSRTIAPFTGDPLLDSVPSDLPYWLRTVKLGIMLRWLPGVGPATVEKILGQVPSVDYGPDPNGNPLLMPPYAAQQLSELNYRQRVSLSLLIERWEK